MNPLIIHHLAAARVESLHQAATRHRRRSRVAPGRARRGAVARLLVRLTVPGTPTLGRR